MVAVLRRLLLVVMLVGLGMAVRRFLLDHQDAAVGSPDHWPAVPRKPASAD